MQEKHKKIFWFLLFIILIIVSCDRDAFRHLDNASRFFKIGMYEQAVTELKNTNRFLKDHPQFQNSMYKYLMWGVISLKEGNQPEAIANFSRALEIAPDEIQVRFILSSLYLQQNDHLKALALFKEKKYLDLNFGAPSYLNGIKNYYNGELSAAISNFQETARALSEEYIYFKDDPSQKIVIEQMQLVINSMQGEAYLQLGKYNQAADAFNKALSFDTKNYILETKYKIALLLVQTIKEPKNSGVYATLGYYYQKLNLNDKAIFYYKKAIALYPKSSAAWLGLAVVYKNKLDHKQAEEHLKQALAYAQNPTMIAAVYLELGQLYIEYSQTAQAVEILEKARILDPENLAIKNDLDYAAALKEYQNTPQKLTANLRLGQIYLTRQEYLLALQHFTLAEKQAPDNTEVLLGKAQVYYLQKKYKNALAVYKKILNQEPENSRAFYGLADVYLGLERSDLAIDLLKKVLEKDRQNILLRNKLAYIYFNAGLNSEAVKEWSYVRKHINNDEMSNVLDKIIEVIG